MFHYVYILQSVSSKRYYIGSSHNPEKRCEEHNSGLTKSTKNKGPWILKFKQSFITKDIASKTELLLKKSKSKLILQKIINSGRITLKQAGE